jgi:hypothetical protein
MNGNAKLAHRTLVEKIRMPPTVLLIVPLRPENHASVCAAFNVITALV